MFTFPYPEHRTELSRAISERVNVSFLHNLRKIKKKKDRKKEEKSREIAARAVRVSWVETPFYS